MGCVVVLLIICLKVYMIDAEGNCPEKLPLEINGLCYRLYTDIQKYKDAEDNCKNLHSRGRIAHLTDMPNEIAKEIIEFIYSKIKKASFWIGIRMEDMSRSKAKEDRDWTWDWDGDTVMEKDFELWAEEPLSAGLTCGIINGSQEFDVTAVDCGGPRLPVVCMRKKDSACPDDIKPYLPYGDYCIAVLSAPLEYNKIAGACHPDTPTPIKNRQMKEFVSNAVMNSFLGGGVYIGVEKIEGNYLYSLTKYPVIVDMWAEGEPNKDYDCVGLALQFDGSVKLRTMSCEFMASSLCYVLESELSE